MPLVTKRCSCLTLSTPVCLHTCVYTCVCVCCVQLSGDINYEELARSTDDFNAAQLKAVSHATAQLQTRFAALYLRCSYTRWARVAPTRPQCTQSMQVRCVRAWVRRSYTLFLFLVYLLSLGHTALTPVYSDVALCLALCLSQVCVEAGMLALRRDGTTVSHEDFVEGITVVQAKKKTNLNYYA